MCSTRVVGTSRCDVSARVQRAERTQEACGSLKVAPLDAARTAQRTVPTVDLFAWLELCYIRCVWRVFVVSLARYWEVYSFWSRFGLLMDRVRCSFIRTIWLMGFRIGAGRAGI